MDEKILNGLHDIGYNGPLFNKEEFDASITDGQKSIEYTKLIEYLTNELRTLSSIDEKVNAISAPEDSVAFVMELSSFLKELNCPYGSLTKGHVSDRLQTCEERLLVIDYLMTELMGARILQEKKPEKKIELRLHETPEAKDMRTILMTLRFPKPPANITVSQLFQKINPIVTTAVEKCKQLIGTPMFSGYLSEQQWETLNDVQKDLNAEYKIRREMLLTRLDVTIQSFEWSDKTKGKTDAIEKIYSDKRKLLKVEPEVDIADLLAAREDLAIIEKTSSANVRKNTKSALNKVIIGQVPDRGGRTYEHAPPPKEMPSWQQRTVGPQDGRGGRGGQRGGRGGNFNRNDSGRQQNYSQGGSYNQGSAGGYSSSNYSGGNRGGYNDNSSSGNRFQDNQRTQSFDSAGSYGSNRRGSYGDTNYNPSSSSNFSKSTDYNRDSGSSNFNRNSGNNYRASESGGYSQNERKFDSAGSYGGSQNSSSNYEQQNKRAKTYDNYQSFRTTHADEYVKESQNNQQYRSRGSSRGQSNYNRGGGGANRSYR